MLTKIQAEIIQGIIEITQNPEIVTIKSRSGTPRNYAYGLISGSRRDLDRLRDRQILSFKRGYCEPQVTEKGLSILRQFQILNAIENGVIEEHKFIVEKICAQIPDLKREDAQNFLSTLLNNDLIAGELSLSTEEKYAYRLVSAWVTNRGQVALKTPDIFWNDVDSQFSTKSQSHSKQSHNPTHQNPQENRFSHVSNLKSERRKTAKSNDTVPAPTSQMEAHMEAHIDALKALAQSMPEDRRSQIMGILDYLSETVASPAKQCA